MSRRPARGSDEAASRRAARAATELPPCPAPERNGAP
jgi:hypothetical protein